MIEQKEKLETETAQDYLSIAKRGNNKWWTYLIGIPLIISVVLFLSGIPVEILFEFVDRSQITEQDFYVAIANWDFEALGLSNNTGLAALIMGFALSLTALILVYRYLHKKSLWNLINPFQKIRWDRIAFAFIIWGGLMLVELALDMMINGDQYVYQFNFTSYLPLLFVCLLLLPIQTSFEELFIRGYLLQGISLLTKYAIIPVVATSIFFATAHMWNPEVAAFGWPVMFSYYFAFAFALALITIWDKGIEIALGVHAANNIIGALTVTYDDAVIKTDSIWSVTINHIGWMDIMLYISFFVILTYAYYWRYIRKSPSKLIAA